MADSPAPSDRRDRERRTIEVIVTCRAPAVPVQAVILDLSRTGCRVLFPENPPERGATLTVDLGCERPVIGSVVRVSGFEVGVSFERPIPPAAAVRWGLEAAPPPPPPIEPIEKQPELPHAFRRLKGLFGN